MPINPPPINSKRNPNPRISTTIQGTRRNELLKAYARAEKAIEAAHAPSPQKYSPATRVVGITPGGTPGNGPSKKTIFTAAGNLGQKPVNRNFVKSLTFSGVEMKGVVVPGVTRGHIGTNEEEAANQSGGRRSKRRQTKKQIKKRRRTRRQILRR
uniref:Uncharacterized protein n=1 Tax=viral metagenome TaxID=1070528 RepID=A0A6C0APN0_9ZZZZ